MVKRKRIVTPRKKKKNMIFPIRKKLRKTTGLVLDVAGANIMISTAKGLR